ncbi:MAG: biotin synthase BioB [Trichlorobacter sp.]|uniref:biotin synthase BioB n=1 Tax=Trichlorobacter sp. TaxID=2911007 RepID=UPI002564BD11|nr:biotin synthase BioB [Trichlorobacter sp.]MDK9717028.1 biotin synthase BioB [Trichlorobacter sp.]
MIINDSTLDKIVNTIIDGNLISCEQALVLADLPRERLSLLFAAASRVREHHFGNRVSLCGIINAKSGLCPEDCAFCAQSSYHSTGVVCYPLLDQDTLLAGARSVAEHGAACYGIVTSGSGVSEGDELEQVCATIRAICAEGQIAPGASLGTLTRAAAEQLKAAGLVTYHHNLETSRSFFPQICSTHDYDDDVATVRLARQVGLRVCCGGLFGLGESMTQRVELALTLRELQVDSVPINFLDPVPGTPLAAMPQLTPLDCLHTIALFRLILPDAHITVCGGRQRNLRELQSWVFLAGASGIMTGNYLTKEGRQPADDLRMIEDLGLVIAKEMLR